MTKRRRIKCYRCEKFDEIKERLRSSRTTPAEICKSFNVDCYEEISLQTSYY